MARYDDSTAKIKWNGELDHPLAEASNNSVPASVDIVWGANSYTWNDVVFVIEIADGIGTYSRQERLDKLLKDKKKRTKLIHLICRVKGEKVYDEIKETKDTLIIMEDVDLVINEVLGKMKVNREENYGIL